MKAQKIRRMRNVIVSEFVTLDGVMEDPGGSEKTKNGGWSFKFRSMDQNQFKFDELFASDGLLLGRVTYQGFAAAWPSMPPDPGGYSKRMNSLPKYVVSKSLEKVEWNNSRLIRVNVAEEVAKLKMQPGRDILVFGSGELANGLMQSGLIDELRLFVHPIVLGSGKRLFKSGIGSKLKFMESRTFDSGVVLLRYQPITKEEN
jgi:dihydrofolate reductase